MSTLRLVAAAIVLVSAAACGGSYSSPSTSPSPTPTPTPGGPVASVLIPIGAQSLGNRAYTPAELDINVGTTVTWMNTDAGVPHTTTSNAPGWDSGTVQPGTQFSHTFQTAGTFAYHCNIHPGMMGTVVVR